jgi:hypothetical protein
MEKFKICKSSKNLTIEGSISNTLCINNRNNLSNKENMDSKNILINFISSKNKMTLKSCFDRKGSKKFLSDKEKAMAFLELPDDIIEEKIKKKRQSKKGIKKKERHRSESHKELINILIKRLKYIKKDRKDSKKKMMSDKTVNLHFAENYKKHQKKTLTINNDFSDIKGKESLELASDHNDSFIHSILKEMIKC